MPLKKIAVVGAGIAGLNAARILYQADFEVQVFEKSRGLGGRLAARRTDFGVFNHGAQFATARHPDFIKYLDDAIRHGSAELWSPACYNPNMAPISGSLDRSSATSSATGTNTTVNTNWFRGFPAMNKLVAPLLAGFAIHHNIRIARIAPLGNNRFELFSPPVPPQQTSAVSHGVFDGVVVAIPAPQSAEILMPLSARFDVIDDVKMAPCWAAIMAFENRINTDFDVLTDTHPAISWMSRNAAPTAPDPTPQAKSGVYDRWTIHTSPQWSQDHVDETADNVGLQIENHVRSVFAGMNIALPAIAMRVAHRWRFARTIQPLGQSHISAFDGRIAAAGDWCMGARIEAAYESGESAANAIMTAF
ncbi:NAD(P)/FAD-dependent oxidoreductase [Thalassospira mesophila]|uniref:Amine oxidase domain-containing protein n=1 Tax=Thalassospira mesophila TaxID=1293891 RepID=A0A1Y2KZ66_9PROT|nr:FAD-dependent oxidoreductase [Thalassospira mesophila]OSQ37987.1 hypothetical protein TMES_13555 [Thalassospira mesophila]